ncbi:MAG: AMP-binding protein [Nocardiopsaceae bacterium]|jgi:acyl-CoA synthetase (AMP-forming)/AMP-acid ligase II|nr:AMP-binding protein [Nocardiopsaceae bacterium]
MSKLDDLVAEVSVTKRLVSIAAGRADQAALLGGPGPDGRLRGGSYSYASLATTIQAAAAGLTWRGLRPRDVVGVLAPDVVGFTLAVHAVRAAGGVPSPVDVSLCAAEVAGQLAESGARMVITAPPLTDTALLAVDRSWVRQVYSFADAPGATRFSDLLGLDMIRPSRGRPDDVALLPFSRGQDGRLRPVPVSHRELVELVDRADQGAGITHRDVVLAVPPVGNGLGYAAVIDSALLRGASVVAVQGQEINTAADAHRATAVLVPKNAGLAVPDSVRAIPVE